MTHTAKLNIHTEGQHASWLESLVWCLVEDACSGAQKHHGHGPESLREDVPSLGKEAGETSQLWLEGVN